VDAVLPAIVDCGERDSREGLRCFAPRCNHRSFFTDIVAWFIVVACAATLWVHGWAPSSGRRMRRRQCGRWPATTRSSCLPSGVQRIAVCGIDSALSTAYTVCEGLGFESGVDKSFKEAPFFYWLYTLLMLAER